MQDCAAATMPKVPNPVPDHRANEWNDRSKRAVPTKVMIFPPTKYWENDAELHIWNSLVETAPCLYAAVKRLLKLEVSIHIKL